MRQFLALLRSFSHSSLLCTFSCHHSPPTLLPSSLTSSCHLFLGLPLNLVVFKFIYNNLLGILFSSILCTCPNQHNLFNLTVYSYHHSPLTILPSSLTSCCHLFLGLSLNLVVSKIKYNIILGILVSSILCTCPNQHNLFNLTVYSYHHSPLTILPSSLTSSCHLFLGLPVNLVVPKFKYNTILGILFSSILCTCPNQHNLFNLTVYIIVGF